MATIIVPTQQQLYDSQHDPNSLLAQYNAANAPKPAVGSPAAVTAAGAGAGSGATGTNLNALNSPEWITSMTEMINQLNTQAQQASNAARIPGAAGLEKQSSGNIASMLEGNVPADVYREMAQRSAERGVATGSPMGANSTADIMRALGLTSLDMTNQGQQLLSAAYARNPGAPIANPQALVTTPAQAEALRLQQENMILDYNARMAAIQAAKDRNASGYGRGGGYPSGGGGGGSFAPATNWSSGQTTTTPWNLPNFQTPSTGTTAGSAWTPGTYTEPMNPLYGYTQEPGLPNTVPGGSPWTPPAMDSWDNLLPPMTPDYQQPGQMTQDEIDWYLYGG